MGCSHDLHLGRLPLAPDAPRKRSCSPQRRRRAASAACRI